VETFATIRDYSARYDAQIAAYNQAILPPLAFKDLRPARPALDLLTIPSTLCASPLPVYGARAVFLTPQDARNAVRNVRTWIIDACMGPVRRHFWDREPEPPHSIYKLAQ
jgi:hypothetical protein